MIPGLKFKDDNNNQIVTWTSTHMRITQNPMNEFSHKGAYSIDQSYSGNRKQYAPVDMVCVKNNGATSPGGATYFHSIKPVVTPSGLTHITIALTHDNNASNWVVGQVYPQGTHFYTEGDAGYVTGVHVHIEQALGHVTTQYQNAHGVWCLTNQVRPDSVFFIDHTEIIQANTSTGLQMNWKTHGGGGGIEPQPPKDEKITLVFGHMEIGGVKVGDTFKVIERKGDRLILEKVQVGVEYVRINKNVKTYTVHPIGQLPTDHNIKALLRPIKFGGLEYQVLGKPYKDVVTIQTRDYGKVNIVLTKHTEIITK